jgi:hypothetical protein
MKFLPLKAVLLCIAWSFVLAFAQGERTYSDSFTLGGEVGSEQTYTLETLQALPSTEVEVTFMSGSGEQKHTYKGVLLYDLLNAAKPTFDSNTKNDALQFYVRVGATDGYAAVIAWGELDPGFGNKQILIAYEEDGKPMTEDGLARLIVPGDVRGGRYVSNINSISLVRATKPQ